MNKQNFFNKFLLYWLFIIAFLLIFNWLKTNAYNGDDIFSDYDTLNNWSYDLHQELTWQDFLLKKIKINDIWATPQGCLIEIYDNTILVYSHLFDIEEEVILDIVIKWDLKIINNWPNQVSYFYNWYYFDEWDIIEVNSIKDYKQILINFLSWENSFIIFSLIAIWFICIYIIILDIKWGFKSGVLFFKNKYIWKK